MAKRKRHPVVRKAKNLTNLVNFGRLTIQLRQLSALTGTRFALGNFLGCVASRPLRHSAQGAIGRCLCDTADLSGRADSWLQSELQGSRDGGIPAGKIAPGNQRRPSLNPVLGI